MERTIFIRFMQCLGSWGGIVFEIIMAKVGLSSPIYSKIISSVGTLVRCLTRDSKVGGSNEIPSNKFSRTIGFKKMLLSCVRTWNYISLTWNLPLKSSYRQ